MQFPISPAFPTKNGDLFGFANLGSACLIGWSSAAGSLLVANNTQFASYPPPDSVTATFLARTGTFSLAAFVPQGWKA